jgi:hypothetical protein
VNGGCPIRQESRQWRQELGAAQFPHQFLIRYTGRSTSSSTIRTTATRFMIVGTTVAILVRQFRHEPRHEIGPVPTLSQVERIERRAH